MNTATSSLLVTLVFDKEFLSGLLKGIVLRDEKIRNFDRRHAEEMLEQGESSFLEYGTNDEVRTFNYRIEG